MQNTMRPQFNKYKYLKLVICAFVVILIIVILKLTQQIVPYHVLVTKMKFVAAMKRIASTLSSPVRIYDL